MKKIIITILMILNLLIYIPALAKSKELILNDMKIVIDPGHGGKDVGTFYKDVYEKDINLIISLYLKKELERYGANIIMTREGDYDLSYPNASFRKKSDFNNRIKIINENKVDLFLSIHQNYYNDSKYGGIQIFYKNDNKLGDYIQNKLNKERKTKEISKDLYMYKYINTNGLLIECSFLSNENDRNKITNKTYQKEFAKKLSKAITDYYITQ